MRRVVGAMLVAWLHTAHAEPTDFVAKPLVLERGQLEGQLTIEANLASGSEFAPLSLAPDIWVGVTPRLTLGLIHGHRSLDQIDTGGSFCVRTDTLRCERAYRGSGIDARWSVQGGPLALAARVRLILRDIEPAKPAVTLGALGRWTSGRFAIASDPYLRLGLANLDQGNRAALVIPIWLQMQPTCRWLLAIHTGWDSDLAVVKDGWHIPLGLAAAVHPYRALEVGAEFGFPSLLGPQNNIGAGVLLVTVGWLQ